MTDSQIEPREGSHGSDCLFCNKSFQQMFLQDNKDAHASILKWVKGLTGAVAALTLFLVAKDVLTVDDIKTLQQLAASTLVPSFNLWC